jgi:membrane protease YdiL (CAAX protease family)
MAGPVVLFDGLRQGLPQREGSLMTAGLVRMSRRGRLAGVPETIRAHPLPAFFALAYAVSWGILLVLYGMMRAPAAVVIFVQTLGPTIAARIVLTTIGGRVAYREMRHRGRLWRVPFRWYLLGLAVIPAACLGAVAVLPGGIGALQNASAGSIVSTFAFFLVFGFFSGPLFEEPGWRGFALPRLERDRGPLVGTLILGVLWGVWHLPQFLVPEWAAQNGGSDPATIAAFLVLVMTLSPVLTWVYNRTGSLWLAMVTHASINASLSMGPVLPAAGPMLVGIVAFGAISLVLVITTRGRFGYDTQAQLRV